MVGRTAETVQAKRWTRQEYERIVAAGLFDQCGKVELVEGEIIEVAPMGSRHAAALGKTYTALSKIVGDALTIRIQMPLATDPRSEPEPDVAVVQGRWEDWRDEHPSSACLVVEVADDSLEKDRRLKSSLYARAGIEDYWILNLTGRMLEVYRDPRPEPEAVCGWVYSSVRYLTPQQHISPLFAAEAAISVATLMP